ncbi:bromodomain adjacent to Zinc finger domain protein 1a [Plakobranchus ocellatus]|uniref:Bromodomain adjacent to zinc finger domain protein 1A n=1 Tax=Plakobranchus ocellatus TaxID=259542 RepID=A0AAV3YIV6_9GAST|nr:bromodomain adjacent to Zinc finger domain protein 1a [Plakobranchus ocellatus]
MPLLRKQPFRRQKIPHDLDPEEEVFHCKITNEIFRDYNAFFERIILCNSLVWSCAITGKSGMTFQEAEECEEKAKKNLATFQDSLKKPLLFLTTLTHRSRLNDVNDDVFLFAKDRFFIGETVEYSQAQGNKRDACKILEVLPPPETKTNGDIIVIDDSDDSNQAAFSDSKIKNKKAAWSDPSKFSYKIKLKGSHDVQIVSATTLSRKKGLYSRERSKLFVKQHCEPVEGLFKVKESTLKKLNLMSARFEDFFAGPIPQFEISVVKKIRNVKRSFDIPDNHIEFEEPPNNSGKALKNNKGQKVLKEPQVEYVPLPTAEDKALMKEKLKQQKLDEKRKLLEEKEAKKEEMRRQFEAEKLRRKEEKDRERMKKLEEKRREMELYKEWCRPRDDLECDDLKEMPEFVPVRTRVPAELFGDAAMILEFAHIFKAIFDFKQFFPKGFTWGMIESALVDHEPDGPLCDLLQMLLCALFNLQEEEADEYQELEKEETAKLNEEKDEDMEEELSKNEVILAATVMAQFSQNTLGMPLRDTLLDQFTLSEIVHIHLLASGARASNKNARFRYQQRGGYTSHDDPGLELKLEDPGLVRKLGVTNVFDLTPKEKVKIITTLIHQILTFAMVRDTIEDASERLRIKKYDLKQFQWAEQRREKEEQAARMKRVLEEKAREQARRMQQLIAEHQNNPDGIPSLPLLPEVPEEKIPEEKQREHEMDTRKKLEFSKKECEMMEEIQSLQHMVSIYPIGRDRLFRRYYFFSSLNGLFIEDHELHVPKDMLTPGAKPKLLPELTFQGEDKENGTKSNGDDCIVISDDENSDKKSVASDTKVKEEATDTIKETDINGRDTPPVLESESSLPESHKQSQKTMWAFIDTPEHLDALMACLNTRGFRECALRTALKELKPLLQQSLRDCPTDMLSLPEDGGEEKARIQIKDRAAWRDAILKRSYDSQAETSEHATNTKVQLNGNEEATSEESQSSARDLAKALAQIARGVELRFLKEPLKEDETKKKKQVKDKDKKKKDEDEVSDEEASTKKSLFERWEESLLNGASLSHVYLHLATLDKSIVWAKSTLETRCRLCRRKGDAEKMLLCDGCDRGHHMYCLKPPMEKVPTGDWFCPDCRPKQTPKSPTRKGRRKTFTEEEEEEEQVQEEEDSDDDEIEEAEEEDMEEEEEADEEEEIEEEEAEDEEEEESDEEEEDGDGTVESIDGLSDIDDDDIDELNENPEDDVCIGCGTPGMLICCDCCPRAYHLHCAKPPLKKVPKGKWMCQVCMGIERTGKIKIGTAGVSRAKTKTSNKFKGRERSLGSAKSTPTNSRPSSRRESPRESPRDSPVMGGRPKKHSVSQLVADELASVSTKTRRGSRPRSRLSLDSAGAEGPIIRMMKAIAPSSKRANSQQQQLKAAEVLVNELIKHEDAWPFLKPVDKKLVPDYYDVIKRPMDFGTIRNKIHAFAYEHPGQMLDDIRLIFHNCAEYNSRNSFEFRACGQLMKVFEKRTKELGLSEDAPSTSTAKSSRGRISV